MSRSYIIRFPPLVACRDDNIATARWSPCTERLVPELPPSRGVTRWACQLPPVKSRKVSIVGNARSLEVVSGRGRNTGGLKPAWGRTLEKPARSVPETEGFHKRQGANQIQGFSLTRVPWSRTIPVDSSTNRSERTPREFAPTQCVQRLSAHARSFDSRGKVSQCASMEPIRTVR